MNEPYLEDEGPPGGVVKKFMFINRHAPYGTVYALEGLEVVLIGSAFEQDISMVFVDDGVYQLKKGQDTGDSDMKNFSPTFRALEMYDVENLYVEEESMQQRGLNIEDLLVPVEVLSSSQIASLMEEQDVLLNF